MIEENEDIVSLRQYYVICLVVVGSDLCTWSASVRVLERNPEKHCVYFEVYYDWKCHQYAVVRITGWPKSKFAISNGYNSENMHFRPHVGKAKMCFGGLHLFSFFSCLFTIFKNKWRPPKHNLAFPTWPQKFLYS